MLVFFTNGDLLHNLYYVNLWILNNPPPTKVTPQTATISSASK